MNYGQGDNIVDPGWTVATFPWFTEAAVVDMTARGLPAIDFSQQINLPQTTLLTLDDLKSLLGITGDTQDADLTLIGAAVTESVRQYCGRVFNYGVYVSTVRFASQIPVYLPETPVWQVIAVEKNGVDIGLDCNRTTGKLSHGRYGVLWADDITAIYVAGYPVLPGDLKIAYASMCKARLDAGVVTSGGLSADNISSITIPDVGSIKFGDSTPTGGFAAFGEVANHKPVLDRYRSPMELI